MFLNRGKAKGGVSPTQLGRWGEFPAEDVRRALRHTLRLLSSAVSFARDDASFRRRTDRIAEEVARASLREDFVSASDDILELRLPFKLTEDPGSSPGVQVLLRCIDAAQPIARSLELEPPVKSLDLLRTDLTTGEEESEGVRRYVRDLAVVAEGASFTRQVSRVLRLSISELVHLLSGLTEAEPGCRDRLAGLRDRLVAAGDLEELERLRTALLEETTALIEETQARTARLASVGTQVAETTAYVQSLQAALADAETMATTDALTGLGNRRALDRAVASYRSNARAVGVLMVDIDHFKRINDTYGHDVGDCVLRQIAQVVNRELRGDDRAFRVGGEELLVLLGDTKLQGAVATAERLRDCVARTSVVAGDDIVTATISIGASTWQSGTGFKTAMEAADKALYRAKRQGRNRVQPAS